MSLRKFAPTAASYEDNWFDNPIQDILVKIVGQYSATADGACPVELPGGSMAYMKPRPDTQKNLVVAREKIAADLAHLLGLPVAPTVVKRPNPADGACYHSALSLVCLAAGRTWQNGGQVHVASCFEALESLRVFWSWIGDIDHNGHPGNLVYQVTTGGVDVVAIDHSYSLCHQNLNDPLTSGACNGYQTEHLPQSTEVRRKQIAAIQALDATEIERLVRRLGEILTIPEQDRILGILDVRSKALIKMLKMEGV